MYNEWIIDSGASDHMITVFSRLINYVKAQGNTSINFPNGHTKIISHFVGSVQLNSGITLKNVLCVHEYKHNLLSVNKLVSKDNCKV